MPWARVLADDISLIPAGNGACLGVEAQVVFDSAPGGNNDRRFDPGEFGELVVELHNFGGVPAQDLTARLKSCDARFRVEDSLGSYGEVGPDSSRGNYADRFACRVDPAMPQETPVRCTLFLASAGYVDTLATVITVGELLASDPIPDGPREPPRYWAFDDADREYSECPEFNWIECRGRGTRLALGDDQTVTLDLPFGWRYYGVAYRQLSVCSNGWVAPGVNGAADRFNQALPAITAPPMVAVNWDDLYPPTGGGIWYYHDVDRHCVVIEWDSVYYFSPPTAWDKCELVIFDSTVPTPTGDNVLLAQYRTANCFTGSTVGLQDPTQTVGILYLFDSFYHQGASPMVPGRVIKYTTRVPVAAVKDAPSPRRGIAAGPNPFRDRVRLTLPAGASGVVRVFDASGRAVRRLAAQSGLTVWDGRDDAGRALPGGTYFVQGGASPVVMPVVRVGR